MARPLRLPWVTLSLAGLLSTLMAVELALGEAGPQGALPPQALMAFGGLFRPAVTEAGQWYRLLSAPFLHGSAVHLLINGVALLLAGAAVERCAGRAWTLAVYVLGALGGSLASLAWNPEGAVSVGASGAVLGLCAAGALAAFRLPRGRPRVLAWAALAAATAVLLLPSLLPAFGGRIDVACHAGGTAAGLVAGAILLAAPGRGEPRPPLPRLGRTLAVAAVVGSVACIALALAGRAQVLREIERATAPSSTGPAR